MFNKGAKTSEEETKKRNDIIARPRRHCQSISERQNHRGTSNRNFIQHNKE